jgi:hypothetical protein
MARVNPNLDYECQCRYHHIPVICVVSKSSQTTILRMNRIAFRCFGEADPPLSCVISFYFYFYFLFFGVLEFSMTGNI